MTAPTSAQVIATVGLGPEIDRLKQRIDAWVARSPQAVLPMLRQQFGGGSKYFRPMTVFTFHRAVSERPVPERVMLAAQSIEMFHNITLIIDDIVDKSRHRRNTLNLHDKYHELTAYMVAGYIDAQITRLVTGTLVDEAADRRGEHPEADRRRAQPRSEYGEGEGSVDRIAQSCLSVGQYEMQRERDAIDASGPVHFDLRLLLELKERLALAECIQWDSRKGGSLQRGERLSLNLGLADWRYLAREDTGSMFEICACLGSRSQRFRRLGRLIGMLYHACDDIADIRSASGLGSNLGAADKNARRLGGTGNEDLNECILTLPAALAIEHDARIRELFEKQKLTHDELRTLHAAFFARLEDACQQLLHIRAQALEEMDAVGVRNRAQMVRLIDAVYDLSGCPPPS